MKQKEELAEQLMQVTAANKESETRLQIVLAELKNNNEELTVLRKKYESATANSAELTAKDTR